MPAPDSKPAPAASWVALGVFTQPHGVSGRIKVKSFTEPMDAFADHADLTDEQGKTLKLKITGHTQGIPVVAVEGITDRDQAALLRGKKIGVSRASLPEIATPNRFYTDDLIGMVVIDHLGAPFGEVIAVVNYGAGDILDIRRADGKEEMYAFTHVTFPVIDMDARRITIDPPDLLK